MPLYRRKIFMWFKRAVVIFFIYVVLILVVPVFAQKCNRLGIKPVSYEVIVVLGNPSTDDCKPAPIMKSRVDKGIELFKENKASFIIFTGSAVGSDCIEADVMAKYATSKGIPNDAIIRERKAKNTYQNAFFAVQKLDSIGADTALVVTSCFHVNRACNIFSNYDLYYDMKCSEVPSEVSWLKILFWNMRERTILSYHTLFGYSKSFGL